MQHDIDDLIAKKLKGDISPEEASLLDDWRQESSDHETVYGKLVQYWNAKHFFSESKRNVWSGLREKLSEEEETGERPFLREKAPEKSVFKSFFTLTWRVAAVVTLLMVAYWGFDSWSDLSEERPEIAQSSLDLLEKTTPLGIKLNLKLADGTEVKLNAGSSLKFPKHFEGDEREVFLEGEAFFDVAHDTAKPFIIHSQQIETRVLGTSFNVKAGKEAVQVLVVTGKVAVTNTENEERVVLPPDQMATYSRETDELKSEVANSDLLAWKYGIILFKEASMEKVDETLRHWYGVNFTYKRDVQLPGGFTARFKNQSLENILESISYAGKFNFKIEGKEVIIY